MISTKATTTSALLVSLALAGLVGACSSPGKPEPQLTLDSSGSQPRSDAPSAKADEPAPVLARDLPPEARYKGLRDAVRAGNGTSMVEEAARILGSNPNDPVALNALALANLRRGRPGAAKVLLARAFEKNAPTAALHNNMAAVLLEEGDQVAAVTELKKALRLDGSHPEALGNLGSIYLKGGDAAKALPLLEQAYRRNRAQTAIAVNYAIALRHAKDYNGAARIYDDLLKQNPKDVGVLVNYAILLIEFMGKPKDGLDLVYKVKFLDIDRKDVLERVNALEKRAKSELKL